MLNCFSHIFIAPLLFSFSSLLIRHARAQAAETLREAINDGRPPHCNQAFGRPFPEECNDGLNSFLATIVDRGFTLEQTVEFLGPGTSPMHADQYPRQPLRPYLYTFSVPSVNGDDETCVIQYGMQDTPEAPSENIPRAQYPSALATHSDFVASTKLLITECAEDYQVGGWIKIRGVQGRDLVVVIIGTPANDPGVVSALETTREYQFPAANRQLIKTSPQPVYADPGQGSSTGAGTGTGGNEEMWATVCAHISKLSTEFCAINQRCEPVELRNREVMWGTAMKIMLDFAGTCVEAFDNS
ncbi:MAG: hypothetical protein M1836_006395 [Candelina mexicana]|nr:MAG: hypothetical protein M1836_006395 [Candelina mexicana]